MRVLVAIPCLLTGGTEMQTLSLVEALRAAGHEVAVACYFEHAAGVVARYESTGANVYLLSPDGVRPQGVAATLGHIFGGLRKTVKDFGPDAVHVQYMAPGALAVGVFKLLGVKKIIITTHTGGDIYSKRSLQMIRWIARSVTAFQCITMRAEESYFGSSSMFEGKLKSRKGNHFTIYNALPSQLSIREQPREIVDRELTIGVVSRLEHIKGMDLVVPAFAKVLASGAQARLLVVGDGSLKTLMESQALEAGISDRVEFAGRKTQSELAEWYDKIDILLMPSRSEGFGLTALEGMARGCVPVVADIGGLPEVVTADSGLLHAPQDIDDMACKILQLFDLSTLALKSDGAVNRVKNFEASAYNQSIAQLYNSI